MIRPLEMIVQPGRRVLHDFWANRATSATFLIIIALWCLVSSFIFWIIERRASWLAHLQNSDVVPLTFGRALYFTAMNVTTVGFGDVVPRTGLGEVLAAINGLAGLVMFGFLIGATTAALQPSVTDDGLTQTDDEPKEGLRSNDKRPNPADELLEAVAHLITSSRRGIVDPGGMVLGVEIEQERAGTIVHVVVSFKRDRDCWEIQS